MYRYTQSCRCRWPRNGCKKEFWFSVYHVKVLYLPTTSRFLNWANLNKILQSENWHNWLSKQARQIQMRAKIIARSASAGSCYTNAQWNQNSFFINQRPPAGPFEGPSSNPPALLLVADFASIYFFENTPHDISRKKLLVEKTIKLLNLINSIICQ